jgi:hypothetical protein
MLDAATQRATDVGRRSIPALVFRRHVVLCGIVQSSVRPSHQRTKLYLHPGSRIDFEFARVDRRTKLRMKLSRIALFLCVSSCRDMSFTKQGINAATHLGLSICSCRRGVRTENSAHREIPYHGQVYPQSVRGDFKFLGCEAERLKHGCIRPTP